MGIEFIGLDRVIQQLGDFNTKVANPVEFKNKASVLMLADINNSFASGVIKPGLEAKTIRRKKGDARPLYRSGDYAKSFKPRFAPDAIEAVSNSWYGALHHDGEGGMKKREVALSEQVISIIFTAFQQTFTL